MPTQTSDTNNMNNSKWKGFGVPKMIGSISNLTTNTNNNKVDIYPKKYNIAGMYKPFFNKQSGSSYESGGIGFKNERESCTSSIKAQSGEDLAYPGTGDPYAPGAPATKDPNQFKARPMKHYRLQYGNDNNKQTYNNRYLLNAMNKPGGVILKSYSGMKENHVAVLPPPTSTPTTATIDGNWIETMSAYNVLQYGKDKGFYSTKKLEGESCNGEIKDWEKLIEAGVDKTYIANLGLYESAFLNGGVKTTMKGLGSAIRAYPEYTLGKFNKVGKHNPIYNKLGQDNYQPNSNWSCENCPNYQCPPPFDEGYPPESCTTGNKKCINICDPPTKAKKRVRTSSRINSENLCEKPYYMSHRALMRARQKTFKQNSFKYTNKHYSVGDIVEYNTLSTSNNGGSAVYNIGKITQVVIGGYIIDGVSDLVSKEQIRPISNGAYSQGFRTYTNNKKTDCKNEPVGCNKDIYYKPNNVQFAQQGGVSSSSRLLRLKLNTINNNANSVKTAYGKGAASALAYSGRPETPFITKQKFNAGGYIKKSDYKYYIVSDAGVWAEAESTTPNAIKVLTKLPCNHSLYYKYRGGGGNIVTSVMNNEHNNKIIGRFNPTSNSAPNFNVDPGNPNQKLYTFTSRQNKTVNRVNVRTGKIKF
ncbi:hypothetical protein OAA43_00760 [bacterium]|nr:hypothetical protein [bacterium]